MEKKKTPYRGALHLSGSVLGTARYRPPLDYSPLTRSHYFLESKPALSRGDLTKLSTTLYSFILRRSIGSLPFTGVTEHDVECRTCFKLHRAHDRSQTKTSQGCRI
ncbi:hypothetical protein KQX54_020737 [Cotesia glomerata]|uniref:Uncharacterized protein n=1 Tax=Cotesia glomerata TaxID=32391 RepID=A0AAV7I3G2_COTGL|nr:hypothetical protein KQX54_020737 [Cotesia glomerata]